VISVENRKSFPPRVFCSYADGVSFGTGYRRSEPKKTRMMGLSDGQNSSKIGLAV